MPPLADHGEAEAREACKKEDPEDLMELEAKVALIQDVMERRANSTLIKSPDEPMDQPEYSDEGNLTGQAVLTRIKREFMLDEAKTIGAYNEANSAFCHCPQLKISVTRLPQYEHLGKLVIFAIAERYVFEATFRHDILDMIPSSGPLVYRLLCPRGKFRADIWGRGGREQGTGVWDNEFGRGLLVFIEDIEVNHSNRGKGIGTKLVELALDWTKEKARAIGQPAETCSYLVVRPWFLQEDIVRKFGDPSLDTGEYARDYGPRWARVQTFGDQLAKRSVTFWRKQGFRRVGLSGFWAYATNANHPSRQLPAEEDAKYDFINSQRMRN